MYELKFLPSEVILATIKGLEKETSPESVRFCDCRTNAMPLNGLRHEAFAVLGQF